MSIVPHNIVHFLRDFLETYSPTGPRPSLTEHTNTGPGNKIFRLYGVWFDMYLRFLLTLPKSRWVIFKTSRCHRINPAVSDASWYKKTTTRDWVAPHYKLLTLLSLLSLLLLLKLLSLFSLVAHSVTTNRGLIRNITDKIKGDRKLWWKPSSDQLEDM